MSLGAQQPRDNEPSDTLGAAMSGDADALTYRQRMEASLERLDEYASPTAIRGESGYLNALAIKSALSSLSCYAFNNHLPQTDAVFALEAQWGAAMARYNKRFLVRDTLLRSAARYVIWS